MASRERECRKIRTEGAYIVKAAETRSQAPPAKTPPPGWEPPKPTEDDRRLVAALLRLRDRGQEERP